tara:strand:+ start:10169 stop:10972 length:804 start_codon:yes stop_codon:yes gene_type:complete
MQEIETSLRKERPLEGRRVVVTRPLQQSTRFTELLTEIGAYVIQMPTVEVRGLGSSEDLDQAVINFSQFDWVVFTSTNAVRFFAESVKRQDIPMVDFCQETRVCCVGPETAKISASYGMDAECVPPTYTGQGIVDLFSPREDLNGKSFLIPSGSEARPTVPDGLRALGATVRVVLAYETVPVNKVSDKILTEINSGVDLLTFTSPSTVKNFHKLVGKRVCAPVAVIGPVTAEEAEQLGYKVLVQPDEYSISGLVGSIVQYFCNQATK